MRASAALPERARALHEAIETREPANANATIDEVASGIFPVIEETRQRSSGETTSQGAASETPRAGRQLTEHEALLARAAAGDRAAFREVYQRHRSDVTRLVFRMLGPRPDAEDVIQEVFFQVFRSLKDFRGQSKFTTWLHRVTVNVVLMHRRAAKSRPVFADDPIEDGQINAHGALPDEDFARRERMRAFSRILGRLAEKKRVVFILHELEGLAPTEIAKIVDAPVLTVRTRLFYARRELEALLAEEPTLTAVLKEMKAGEEAEASEKEGDKGSEGGEGAGPGGEPAETSATSARQTKQAKHEAQGKH